MLSTMVILGFAVLVLAVAYVFIVGIPLFGIIKGGIKILRERHLARRVGKEEVIVFDRRLGFTMADGGEKKKDEKEK
ncbi:MAG: hypothetical protein NZ583_01105 [Desulfobacterota bacterium]|nr:hypothetical protein [Thermodesulfobacteriota bacterium]MDW8001312.1 hypothetical protein [Deltaproteobacteria bacterium]